MQSSRRPLRAPTMRYVDRPEIQETIADSLRVLTFDGHSLRLELCVNRMDPPDRPTEPSGSQVTVCRLVLSLPLAIDLTKKLEQLENTLKASGHLKVKVAPGPANLN